MFSFFLSFSDSAKFANIARNIVNSLGYGQSFTFWSQNIFELLEQKIFPSPWIPPIVPFSIAGFFKIYGINDFAVIATSFFYFLLSLVFLFLLAKRIFKNNLTATLSVFAIGLNPNVLEYASSGASESAFIFEILASLYFISLKKKWANIFAIFILIMMYFTRMQSFIFITGAILFFLLININSYKKILIYFLLILFVGFVFDRLILLPFSGKYFLYSITAGGESAVTKYLPGVAVSDFMRGTNVSSFSFLTLFKKVFYNLYNFYRLLPQIASPYMWGLFIIGLFKWGKSRIENSFKLATLFMVVVTFFVTALTIPFFRYLHPVIPLVYLFATATLVWIVEKIVSELRVSAFRVKNIRIKKEHLVVGISTLLILFFVVGQTLGVIFLDSRFEAQRTNRGKPPVYVQLSWILRDNTNPDDVTVTNLDTWGSWYGERKTVWFPLEPNQLDLEGEENPFDAIYLTSYLIDDENYYMGEGWREIFNNPENHGNEFIAENYELKGIYDIASSETYEKQNARAILLVRKEMK